MSNELDDLLTNFGITKDELKEILFAFQSDTFQNIIEFMLKSPKLFSILELERGDFKLERLIYLSSRIKRTLTSD